MPVSPYCTLPEQADTWFKAFKKAQEMCGGAASQKRRPPEREVRYLDALCAASMRSATCPQATC